MGLTDALGGLLGGSGMTTLPVPLQPGEVEIAREVASLRPGSLRSIGGDLVLTDHRLAFAPLNTRDVAAVLTWALGKAGAPGPAAQVPGHLDQLIVDREFGGASGLRGIRSVAVGSPPSLLKPPTLIVVSNDGTVEEVGLLHARRSRNGDMRNAAARDRMLAVVQAMLTR